MINEQRTLKVSNRNVFSELWKPFGIELPKGKVIKVDPATFIQ